MTIIILVHIGTGTPSAPRSDVGSIIAGIIMSTSRARSRADTFFSSYQNGGGTRVVRSLVFFANFVKNETDKRLN